MPFNRRDFLVLGGVAAGTIAVDLAAFPQTIGCDSRDSQLWWPRDQALPSFPEAFHLDAADLSTLSGDQQGVLVTLQGVVNRSRPRLYLYWGTDPTNEQWLNTLRVPSTMTTDPWALFYRYRPEIKGAIVYDPDVPDTINIATTLAGVHDAVIATADLAQSLGLRVIDDLRGRFSSKLDVYQWAFTNLWPKLTKRLLTAISPSNTQSVPNVQWTALLKETRPIHDASNRAVYTADLSALLGDSAVYVQYQDAVSSDGWGPSVSQVTVMADGNVLASFQPGTAAEQPFLFDAGGSQTASGWRFADGNSYFIYKFTPPTGTKKLALQTEMWNEFLVTGTNTAPSMQVVNPNFRDYIVATKAPVFWLDPEVQEEATLFSKILKTVQPSTPYLGWFPQGHEMTGVTLCGQNATVVVAADFFFNGSAFSGVRARVKQTQPPSQKPKLQKKIYLSMTMVEGDNIQFNQHRMRQMWDDPGRGLVPLNWSISVLLLDIAPAILNYFQQTQTPNDLLMAGPSGAGYTYPAVWPPADLPDFTRRTGSYMQRTGMNTLFAYNRNDTTDLPLSPSIVGLYKRDIPGLLGIVYNYETSSQVSIVDGVSLVTLLGVNDGPSGATELSNISGSWNGENPLFIAAGLESWNMTPTDAKTLVDSLGPEFEVVRGDVFFQLLKESLNSGPSAVLSVLPGQSTRS
jgi:GxGYxYP putative glycoside hydrolase C-terminal domain/GxGYxY sequence motif in domain of unknown function N-terminal